jgi:uncharacterized protein with HEPN domain
MRSELKRALLALDHIIEEAEFIHTFVADMTFEQFMVDQKTIRAVMRCLEIISEASRRLTDDMRNRHPEIPWTDVMTLGNVYRHWAVATERSAVILAFARNELTLSDPDLK